MEALRGAATLLSWYDFAFHRLDCDGSISFKVFNVSYIVHLVGRTCLQLCAFVWCEISLGVWSPLCFWDSDMCKYLWYTLALSPASFSTLSLWKYMRRYDASLCLSSVWFLEWWEELYIACCCCHGPIVQALVFGRGMSSALATDW